MDLLAEYGDTEVNPIPVAMETSRGLLVAEAYLRGLKARLCDDGDSLDSYLPL